MFEDKQCIVCGATFTPIRFTQVMCPNPECKQIHRRALMREYNKKRYIPASKKREMKRQPKPDTIVGEGYAERQVAKTLSMVSKINTEL